MSKGVLNQRFTDRPMGTSASVKTLPATYEAVAARRWSRMRMNCAQPWHEASMLAASRCAGEFRASAMKA
ncbi:hypothetical protein D3C72_2300880 [compost metagenome]